MVGMMEAAGLYKIANGGMTSFARSVLADFNGDLIMESVVTEISQSQGCDIVETKLQDGRVFRAKRIVSTIPL